MKRLKSVNVSSFIISPLTRWVITIVVLVALLAVVIVLYAQQQTRNSDLKDELSTAQANLLNNSQQKSDLNERLVRANLSLSQLTGQFASTNESMSFEEDLYSAADASGVQVTSISCSAPREVTVGSISYRQYVVSLGVHGDAEDVLYFVNILGVWLPSADISGANYVRGGDGQVDLSATLSVYGYDG
jgi:Tfp pilus assembly protein PilO